MIFLNILTISHTIMFILYVFSSFLFLQQDYKHFFFFLFVCTYVYKKGLFAETQKLRIWNWVLGLGGTGTSDVYI